MISELEDERDRLDEAILALERLSATTRSRGRPPNWRKDLAPKSSGNLETRGQPMSSSRPKKPQGLS